MLKRLTSKKAPKAIGAYSAATQVNNLIYTSGQLPIKEGVIPQGIIEQTKASMDNIQGILTDNGSSVDYIVKTTAYITDFADFADFDKTYQAYFKEGFPSRTAVLVSKLPKDALIEIEVIAKMKEGN
ncbi:Rid family detoxifying hydrolase [Ligilactobacillus sp. WILCCON 0076]|uniref:Rid family detoxifying hydrolase n=1 Tax=Ligilactobacillus ubinensis TaxID=2876789 RepID=A0A9X2JK02_9LACO|nr:Rid family detoxifying hydrolase [Ligilactobacillus ubinensis]MCP0885779.1 Rid family detoxifying hydrolase [Ligilactobacillus ubinensis]